MTAISDRLRWLKMQGIGNCHYPFPQSESAKIDFFNTLSDRQNNDSIDGEGAATAGIGKDDSQVVAVVRQQTAAAFQQAFFTV